MRLGMLTKQPGERRRVSIDYRQALLGGDSITDAVQKPGADDDLVIGSITVASPLVSFFTSGGTHKVSYIVEIVVTTSAGEVFEDEVIVRVK